MNFSFLLRKKYFISLQIIIPAIFSGFSVLGMIVTYHLTLTQNGAGNHTILFLFGLFIALLTFGIGFIMVRLIVKPLKLFVSGAQAHPALQFVSLDTPHPAPGDELAEFNAVYSRVANILSIVEARQLFPEIIGQSRAMRGVLGEIVKIASSDSTILITGESGTGKGLIAKNIHAHSPRKENPFIAINCAAIPETLLESELFGHEKGAFTGAHCRKIGKFELADKGTIFLDEIGDMPLTLQGKLLHAIQNKSFERVGGSKPVHVDVRFISATNRSLRYMTEEGTFRSDLFFRLHVITLDLPPLRERTEDIPLLLDNFLTVKGCSKRFSSEALDVLARFNWPGNVRELESALEQSMINAPGDVIQKEHLPLHILNYMPVRRREDQYSFPMHPNLDDYLAQLEQRFILQALQHTGGVQVKAAQLLGIKERSLWHRIKKYELGDVSQRISNN